MSSIGGTTKGDSKPFDGEETGLTAEKRRLDGASEGAENDIAVLLKQQTGRMAGFCDDAPKKIHVEHLDIISEELLLSTTRRR